MVNNLNNCQKNVYDNNMCCVVGTLYGIIGIGINFIYIFNTYFKSLLIVISKGVLNVKFSIRFGGIKINI